MRKFLQYSALLFSTLAGCQSSPDEALRVSVPRKDVACQNMERDTILAASGQRTDFRTLVREASQADYVLIGEVHDEPAHHAAQTRLIAALGTSRRFKSVLFEMLEPVQDDAANAFTAGKISLNDLKVSFQWTERGWPIWEAYEPIFAAAKASGLHIQHAGLEAELVRHVNSFGFLGLPRRIRQQLDIKPDDKFVVDFERLKSVVASSHESNATTGAPLAISQYAKDAYIAHRLASTGRAILIAGNGHVRNDIGVPGHLRKYRPSVRVVTIGLKTDESGEEDTERSATAKPHYDYIWVTARQCPQSRTE
ncbi:ChaN family lipoprotein [Rhodopseudomonas sp.]|uniref:ChaN family lipoprotein n=1 Tax=Rhodopseudomonas sp. TaxID=1078 RepID=UPI0039E46398